MAIPLPLQPKWTVYGNPRFRASGRPKVHLGEPPLLLPDVEAEPAQSAAASSGGQDCRSLYKSVSRTTLPKRINPLVSHQHDRPGPDAPPRLIPKLPRSVKRESALPGLTANSLVSSTIRPSAKAARHRLAIPWKLPKTIRQRVFAHGQAIPPRSASKASQIRQPEGKRTDATGPASESRPARQQKTRRVRKGGHPLPPTNRSADIVI